MIWRKKFFWNLDFEEENNFKKRILKKNVTHKKTRFGSVYLVNAQILRITCNSKKQDFKGKIFSKKHDFQCGIFLKSMILNENVFVKSKILKEKVFVKSIVFELKLKTFQLF